jgi:SAM-dependent methyltransferase
LVRDTSPGTFPTPENFDKLYRGESSFEGGPKPVGIPWDIHQAQPRLMELEALGGVAGEVLDIGCGLGDNSIFLASRGYAVTGLDGSTAAIEQARSRAAEAGVTVAFGVADATNLTGYDGRFDTVNDNRRAGRARRLDGRAADVTLDRVWCLTWWRAAHPPTVHNDSDPSLNLVASLHI